jgi:drug/metabolite transporter (DMT)-like permease
MAVHLQTPKDRSIGFAFLLITSIGWGLNWPVIKLVLRDWPPLFARGTAGLFAASALAALATLRGQRLSFPRGVLGRLGAASVLNVFAWMGFSTIAMVWLTVSEGALLVYTMPVWAMLFAWLIRGQRPSPSGFAAVVLGVIGLVVLLGGAQITATSGKLPGVLLALSSAVLFAFSTVVFRSTLPIPPLALTAWQVGRVTTAAAFHAATASRSIARSRCQEPDRAPSCFLPGAKVTPMSLREYVPHPPICGRISAGPLLRHDGRG